MKVAHAEQRVLGSHGLDQTSTFRIKTNAHAFRMLSSGLYSDKPAAVLREIACNAADAHVEYGTPDLPIEVKLPNRIDNQFYVKDWGPGLSHEDVMHLYTTYFESTKQDSNDYTGAFGLGSKSPFSYVDSFSIVSVHGGVERTYSAYIGNDGNPTISLLTESPASKDWEHGVQIKLPVKPEHFSVFEQRARDIYRWFKVTPRIVGGKQVDRASITYENEQFMMVKDFAGLGVVMGNVFYPLEVGKLGDMRAQAKSQAVGQLHGLVLKMRIGEVQVAASRETLEYDEASIRALHVAMTRVAEFVAAEAMKLVDAAKTWDKRCEVHDMAKIWTGPNTYGISHTFETLFRAVGFPQADAEKYASTLAGADLRVPVHMGAASTAKVVTRGYRRPMITRVQHGMAVNSVGDSLGAATVRLTKATKVAYGSRVLSQIKTRHELEDGDSEQMLVFTPAEGSDTAPCKAEALAVAKALGITDVVDLATMPLPPGYTPRTKGQRKKRNQALQPLPAGVNVQIYNKDGSHSTSTLDAAPESFMTWGGRGARVFEKSEERDKSLDWNRWQNLWRFSRVVADAIGMTTHSTYTHLKPIQVIKYDLLKRGWRPTYLVMKGWLSQKATRDALAKAMDAWRPTVRLTNPQGNAGHVAELVWMLNHEKTLYDAAVRPHLGPVVAKYIDDVAADSVKAGAKAGEVSPPALQAWDALAGEYGLEPLQRKRSGAFLTIADLDQHLVKEFPMLKLFGSSDVYNVRTNTPARFGDFMQFLLTR